MVDNTIPGEARLALYMSGRYLQELETALRLAGVSARYERPGIDGVIVPRLFVELPGHGDPNEVICTIPREFDGRPRGRDMPDPPWWFMWWSRRGGTRAPICPAVDMNEAARVIAARLREETR
ncbi:MAG TPA: hypothetical protein VFU43_06980 [Streptosporangiaceae bacterium]|nr:hypothetical protein [Streptosporangiaceae bacterium]